MPMVKCVLKCGVDHTWRRTSASLIYILPLYTQSRLEVHLDYIYKLHCEAKYCFKKLIRPRLQNHIDRIALT